MYVCVSYNECCMKKSDPLHGNFLVCKGINNSGMTERFQEKN